jgi:hypothetical protein
MPKNQGWIQLHRKIRDHALWPTDHYSPMEAWLDILLSANHADNKIIIDGQFVIVGRGSFITSEVKLAKRWGWARKTVRKFLANLQNDQMLMKTSTSRYTTLKVQNYEVYQPSAPVQRTGSDTGGEQDDTQVGCGTGNTNNKSKNDNKIALMTTPLRKRTIVDDYHDSFLQKYGTKPVITGKVVKLLNELVKQVGYVETVGRMKMFFADTDKFVTETKHDVSVFHSRINRYVVVEDDSDPNSAYQQKLRREMEESRRVTL